MKFRLIHIAIAFAFSFLIDQFVADNSHTFHANDSTMMRGLSRGNESSLHSVIAPKSFLLSVQFNRNFKILPDLINRFDFLLLENKCQLSTGHFEWIANFTTSFNIQALNHRGPPECHITAA